MVGNLDPVVGEGGGERRKIRMEEEVVVVVRKAGEKVGMEMTTHA